MIDPERVPPTDDSAPPPAAQFTKAVADQWNGALDEALCALPEDPDFPHELIALLAGREGARRKRIWLVSLDDVPVAVVPLRKASGLVWQPVTQYILPGIVVPALPDQLFAALESLGPTLHVALWRTAFGPPEGPAFHNVITTPTHGIDLTADLEAYWKTSRLWSQLRTARNKSVGLTLRENVGGASEWIIAGWARKWGVPDDETQDRILAAQYLEARGQHFSLTLFDGDDPVAGQTCLLHRGTLVGQCFYRERDLSHIGNRLIHLTFSWAQEKGFAAIDIGGGHDYKRRFAPPAGERYDVTIAPPWRFAAEQTMRRAKSRLRRLLQAARHHHERPSAGD